MDWLEAENLKQEVLALALARGFRNAFSGPAFKGGGGHAFWDPSSEDDQSSDLEAFLSWGIIAGVDTIFVGKSLVMVDLDAENPMSGIPTPSYYVRASYFAQGVCCQWSSSGWVWDLVDEPNHIASLYEGFDSSAEDDGDEAFESTNPYLRSCRICGNPNWQYMEEICSDCAELAQPFMAGAVKTYLEEFEAKGGILSKLSTGELNQYRHWHDFAESLSALEDFRRFSSSQRMEISGQICSAITNQLGEYLTRLERRLIKERVEIAEQIIEEEPDWASWSALVRRRYVEEWLLEHYDFTLPQVALEVSRLVQRR